MFKRSNSKNKGEYGVDKIISVANMYYKTDVKVNSDDYLKTYNVFKKGDIAFEGNKNKNFSNGRFIANTIGDGIVSHVFEVFSPIDKINLTYWSYAINNEYIMKYILARSTKKTTMMTNLVVKDFLEEYIRTPCIEEQSLIGKFLYDIDNLITLYQRKLDDTKKLKNALLQKMFPKEGTNVPELRFPGFTDAWEQRKLGELATFSKGYGYTKDDLATEGVPILLYGRLYTDYTFYLDNTDCYSFLKPNAIISTGKEVVVPASGETPEDIARATAVLKAGIILGGDLNIITPQDSIDPCFLALLLSNGSLKKQLAQKAQGKSIVHLHNSDISSLIIYLPVLEEQKAIVRFIKGLEIIITLHQRNP